MDYLNFVPGTAPLHWTDHTTQFMLYIRDVQVPLVPIKSKIFLIIKLIFVLKLNTNKEGEDSFLQIK